MPIVARRAPKPQPVWYVTAQGVRIPGPAPQTRLGITAPRSWIETMNPSYYYPEAALAAQAAAAKAAAKAAAPTPLLVLPSVPTEPLPAGGQFEIQAGDWKVVLTKDEAAAGAEVSLIDRIKAWLAEETIVAGYANQWFVVGGALAYFLFRKK